MATSILANMAKMSTATSGTGTITLGSAVTSFLTLAQAGITDGQLVSYVIEDNNGTGREVGTGIYTASGTTLTRNVINSTNSNAAINLSGNAQVGVTALARDILSKQGDTLAGALNWSTAVTLASASTVNIGAAASNYILISGVTQVTAFDTIAQGAFRWIRWTGNAGIAHNATSLVLNNNGSNISVTAGDIGLAISDGSGNWRYFHMSFGGLPLLNANNLSDVGSTTTSFNNVSPLTTRGDLVTRDASNNVRLPIGAANALLQTNGTDPSWSSVSSYFDTVFGSTQGFVPQRGASVWGGASVGSISPTVDIRTASATITIPSGASKLKVTLVGGGGGGGGSAAGSPGPCCPISNSGGPGGPAGVLVKYLSGLTAGNTLALTIGAAGGGGASGNNAGSNGGDTSLASGSQTITTLTAGKGNGGGGGTGGIAGSVGSSGGGTNGDLNFTGGSGISTSGSKTGETGLGFGPSQYGIGIGNGIAGTGYGGAGTGGIAGSVAVAKSGGAGTAGCAIFEWYA